MSEVFEFDGHKYRQASRHQREWGTNLLSRINLRGDENVLDLGCGDGTLSAAIAENVPDGHVLGVDASSGMIGAAKALEKDNLTFRQLDINKLRFSDEFDLVFSNAALHWIRDHRRLLENVYRALRSGGRVAWNFAGDGTTPMFIEVVREKTAQLEYSPFFQDFVWPWFMAPPAEYQSLLDASPFHGGTIMVEKIDRYFSDADDMIKWIDQPCIVPFLMPLPDSMKEAFRSEIVEDMLKRTRQKDGTHLEKFVRLNVIAAK